MQSNTETELKFRFTDISVWDRITADTLLQGLAAPGSLKTEKLETVYYDTPYYDLKKRKIAYRIRRKEKEWVATVKSDGSVSGCLHERKEWSIRVDGPQPDIGLFGHTPLGQIMREAVGDKSMIPLFKTCFTRKSMILQIPEGGEIEFCADRGGIFADRRMKPLYEIELELKGAKAATALKLGGILAKRYALVPEVRSKYDQGLRLARLASLEGDDKPEKERSHVSYRDDRQAIDGK